MRSPVRGEHSLTKVRCWVSACHLDLQDTLMYDTDNKNGRATTRPALPSYLSQHGRGASDQVEISSSSPIRLDKSWWLSDMKRSWEMSSSAS